MSNANDFIIEDSVLTKYVGPGGDVVIPEGVMKIGDWSFRSTSIVNVVIPEGVSAIGDMAFYTCKDLVSVLIPSSVTRIGKNAFYDCENLSRMSIPENLTDIRESAFFGCKSLSDQAGMVVINHILFDCYPTGSSITIPAGVLEISAGAFGHFDELDQVSLPDSLTHIGIQFSGFRPRPKPKSYQVDNLATWCQIDFDSDMLSSRSGSSSDLLVEKERVVDLVVPEGVSKIGKQAFLNYTPLQSITVPESVKIIGENAFAGCKNLKTVFLSSGVKSIGDKAFYCCENLTDVSISEGLESIGANAFYGCESLRSITLPKSLKSLGRDPFPGNLQEIRISDLEAWCSVKQSTAVIRNRKLLLNGELITEVMFPYGMVTIEDYAFYCCDSIERVVIPETIQYVGEGAFYGCAKLKEIHISNLEAWCRMEQKSAVLSNLPQIFLNGEPITDAVIPEGITKINNYTFYGFQDLKCVTLPATLTEIGVGAFKYCRSLVGINIPESVEYIAKEAFSNCEHLINCTLPKSIAAVEIKTFENCKQLERIELPDGLKYIHEYAFQFCEKLSSITIPSGVTDIGNGAFLGCYSLFSVSIPESVASIGRDAFAFCRSLEVLSLPEGLTSIGPKAFANCETLKRINLPCSLTSISENLLVNSGEVSELILPPSVQELIDSFSDSDFKRLVLQSDFWRALGAKQQAVYYLKRQGKSLAATYAEIITEDQIGPMGEEFTNILKGKISVKECNTIAGFMKLFSAKAPEGLLPALYQALKEQKSGKKALETIENDFELKTLVQKEGVFKANSSAADEKYISLMRANKATAKNAELDLKEYYGLDLQALPIVVEENGGIVPSYFIAWLLTVHEKKHVAASGGSTINIQYSKYSPVFLPEAAKGIAMLDQNSFQNALILLADEYLANKVNSKKKNLSYPICRYATESTLTELGKRALPLMDRFAVITNNSLTAMRLAEKYGCLNGYAHARGLDGETLRDTVLSELGLDEAGKKTYDIGSTIIVAALMDDLSISLFDTASGKAVKSIPKKNADPDKYEMAKADYADVKKRAKEIAKSRNKLLYEAFLDGNEFSAKSWKQSYYTNPLLNRIARLLVWTQGGKTFTLAETGAVDSTVKPYTITDEPIVVAYPSEMEWDDLSAWQKYFTAHGLKQPFQQVWEPVVDLSAVKEDRYKSSMIPFYRFLNQEKNGISVEDRDFHNHIDIQFKDCTATIDRIDWLRHSIEMNDRFEITKFSVSRKSRYANHIVAYLDRVTAWERVRKDDTGVIDLLPGFTLAQISEFVSVAQDANAVNVLALLLEYKNTHFADFNPMDEFTLEW